MDKRLTGPATVADASLYPIALTDATSLALDEATDAAAIVLKAVVAAESVSERQRLEAQGVGLEATGTASKLSPSALLIRVDEWIAYATSPAGRRSGKTEEKIGNALALIQAEYATLVNAERETVRQLGGLTVLGTERHESRRIDRQLRGRAGRQGDAGESVFAISLEDKMFNVFGADKMSQLRQAFMFAGDDDEPLSSDLLTGSLTTIQEKVESYYREMRGNLVRYDRVIDAQRRIFYQRRQQVLTADRARLSALLLDYSRDTARDARLASARRGFGTFFGVLRVGVRHSVYGARVCVYDGGVFWKAYRDTCSSSAFELSTKFRIGCWNRTVVSKSRGETCRGVRCEEKTCRGVSRRWPRTGRAAWGSRTTTNERTRTCSRPRRSSCRTCTRARRCGSTPKSHPRSPSAAPSRSRPPPSRPRCSRRPSRPSATNSPPSTPRATPTWRGPSSASSRSANSTAAGRPTSANSQRPNSRLRSLRLVFERVGETSVWANTRVSVLESLRSRPVDESVEILQKFPNRPLETRTSNTGNAGELELLRENVGFQGFAQRDPFQEWTTRSNDAFGRLSAQIYRFSAIGLLQLDPNDLVSNANVDAADSASRLQPVQQDGDVSSPASLFQEIESFFLGGSTRRDGRSREEATHERPSCPQLIFSPFNQVMPVLPARRPQSSSGAEETNRAARRAGKKTRDKKR